MHAEHCSAQAQCTRTQHPLAVPRVGVQLMMSQLMMSQLMMSHALVTSHIERESSIGLPAAVIRHTCATVEVCRRHFKEGWVTAVITSTTIPMVAQSS